MAPYEIQEAIVISISYSENDLPQVSRTRDYSPNEKLGYSKLAKNHSGGADKYTTFIADELLPFTKKNTKLNNPKQYLLVTHLVDYWGLIFSSNSPCYLVITSSVAHHCGMTIKLCF